MRVRRTKRKEANLFIYLFLSEEREVIIILWNVTNAENVRNNIIIIFYRP